MLCNIDINKMNKLMERDLDARQIIPHAFCHARLHLTDKYIQKET